MVSVRHFTEQRAALAQQLLRRGHEPRVASAFARVPRHRFVPALQLDYAYEDRALPIGEGQTISQPSMIALMLDALDLQPEDRVLEVGAGSGYAAALLGQLCAEVYAVELSPTLAAAARELLAELGADNVHLSCGDGTAGLPERAPFDAILVSAAPLRVPPALLEQLQIGGRIAIPVGDRYQQVLRVGTRGRAGMRWVDGVPCMFVPLLHPHAP